MQGDLPTVNEFECWPLTHSEPCITQAFLFWIDIHCPLVTGTSRTSSPGSLPAAGGIAFYKLGAFGFVAVLAVVVVVVMTLPKTVYEFVVAMISTTVYSICGGVFVVRWFKWAKKRGNKDLD